LALQLVYQSLYIIVEGINF